MAKLEAVVFDADGTLFNSFELIVEAYTHVAKTHNLAEPSVDMIKKHLRLANPLSVILADLFPGSDVAELAVTNNTFYVENALRVAGYEGMQDMLDQLADKGISMAILTGGTHKVHDILRLHQVSHYFMSVVHSERITEHKPHPEGYLLALKECGNIAPENSVMVGDSPSDIGAGLRAGARATIGLTHGNASRQDLVDAGADYIVDSLHEARALLLDMS